MPIQAALAPRPCPAMVLAEEVPAVLNWNPVFEYLPQASVCWPDPAAPDGVNANAAFERTYRLDTVTDLLRLPDGTHAWRLPARDGRLRRCHVHLGTLPDGSRVGVIEADAEPLDPVTSLPDRRAVPLDDTRPMRHGGVLRLRVNGLGTLNARAGMEAGDVLLRDLAGVLQRHAAALGGRACRLAGAELLLIHPAHLSARGRADLRTACEDLLARHACPDVLLSAGAARAPEDGATLRAVLNRADTRREAWAPVRAGLAGRLDRLACASARLPDLTFLLDS